MPEPRKIDSTPSSPEASLEQRFAQTETEMHRLHQLLTDLRQQIQTHQESRVEQEYVVLKDAVLRWAIALGQVEVQVAMLRARGDTMGDAVEHLQRSLEEQQDATHALRTLARSLQKATTD